MPQPDPQPAPEPSAPEPSGWWLAAYSLGAGTFIYGSALLLLVLLAPYGSGLSVGVALGVAAAGVIVAVSVDEPVIRWLAGRRRNL